MEDRHFLMWLHARLTEVHNEDPCYDFMHKLRAIIAATPAGKITPNVLQCNNLDDLKTLLGDVGQAST